MTTFVNGRTFDRVYSTDPKNADWLVADLLSSTPTAYDKVQNAKITALTKRLVAAETAIKALQGVVPPSPVPTPTPAPPAPSGAVLWAVKDVLDQQQTGMCVGYGWTDLVQAAPKAETVIDGSGGDDESSTPDKVYDLSRQIDGDPNPEDPNAGSTVTGGAKACVQLGFISSYHWATTAAQVAQSIQQIGPVVLGTDWTNDMFNPDPSGVIHPTGAVVGGHCYLAHGFDPTTGLIQLRNSWGSGWGIGGDAFISLADLDTLLTAQGEACVPIKP